MPNPGGPDAASGYMMLMLGWVFVASLLYFLRPNALRAQGNEKPSPSQGVCFFTSIMYSNVLHM